MGGPPPGFGSQKERRPLSSYAPVPVPDHLWIDKRVTLDNCALLDRSNSLSLRVSQRQRQISYDYAAPSPRALASSSRSFSSPQMARRRPPHPLQLKSNNRSPSLGTDPRLNTIPAVTIEHGDLTDDNDEDKENESDASSDMDRRGQHRRNDSHELTINTNVPARHSLVDNLVLSLDQLDIGGAPAPGMASPPDSSTASFYSAIDRDASPVVRGRISNDYKLPYHAESPNKRSPSDFSLPPTHQPPPPPTARSRHRGGSLASVGSIGYINTSSPKKTRDGWDLPIKPTVMMVTDPDDFYGAPTPNIPTANSSNSLRSAAQSRSMYPPQPPHPPPKTPMQRRISTKSSRTLTKLRPPGHDNGDVFENISDVRELPPLPAYEDPSAPGPYVPQSKGDFPVQAQKGFFSRVFGGSSRNSRSQLDQPLPALPAMASTISYDSRRDSTLQDSRAVTNSVESSVSLAKKPSGFFRRRRRTVGDKNKPAAQDLPPLPALPAEAPAKPDSRSPSPVSSLRKAMDSIMAPQSGKVEMTKEREARQDFLNEVWQSPLFPTLPQSDSMQSISSKEQEVPKRLPVPSPSKMDSARPQTHAGRVEKTRDSYPDFQDQIKLAAAAEAISDAKGKQIPRTGSSSTIQSPRSEAAFDTSVPAVHLEGSQLDADTEKLRENARSVFEGSEEVVSKAKAAAWLGDQEGETLRGFYMELFDWSNMNILNALRGLCDKLVLKGETQQVDRIITAFSARWVACNPNHGFKTVDVVHTICYSILLLNTDLHLADIPNSQKMNRSQFVKNTMSTIRSIVEDEPQLPHSSTFPRNSIASSLLKPASSATFPRTSTESRDYSASVGDLTLMKRSSSRRIVNSIAYSASTTMIDDADAELDANHAECSNLVRAPCHGSIKVWESTLETVLKGFFNSIRQERLPLHGAPLERTDSRPNTLSVHSSTVRRSPSTISRASEVSFKERAPRPGSRWTARTKSRGRLYPQSAAGSSRTSFDETPMWSPANSSTWSKYSYNKTSNGMSVDSLGSFAQEASYSQAIGFANALSQAIIRDGTSSMSVDSGSAALLEDESLELSGPPWAKEGMLKHKHYLDSVGKKAKDRAWHECFAVIERGWLRLFKFSKKPSVKKHSTAHVFGGGNWMDNAEPVGDFQLRQVIASALPPPGYAKDRPYVWALSLPTGAVHLFEVGTPEIVREFVITVNYWSARLSKEPLVGGVSNIEYGWSDAIISTVSSNERRSSMQSSIRSRSSFENTFRSKTEKIHIADWQPPSQSFTASQLSEQDQLRALEAYVKSIEAELEKHNELRVAVSQAFTSRSINGQKASQNWEKKSSYLLREIVKFRTYIDCLSTAQEMRRKLEEEAAATAAAAAE